MSKPTINPPQFGHISFIMCNCAHISFGIAHVGPDSAAWITSLACIAAIVRDTTHNVATTGPAADATSGLPADAPLRHLPVQTGRVRCRQVHSAFDSEPVQMVMSICP